MTKRPDQNDRQRSRVIPRGLWYKDDRTQVVKLLGRARPAISNTVGFEKQMGLRSLSMEPLSFDEIDIALNYREKMKELGPDFGLPLGRTLWEQMASLLPRSPQLTATYGPNSVSRDLLTTPEINASFIELLGTVQFNDSRLGRKRRPIKDKDEDDSADDHKRRRQRLTPEALKAEKRREAAKKLIPQWERIEVRLRWSLAYVMGRVVMGDVYPDPRVVDAYPSLDPMTHALLSVKSTADACGQRIDWLSFLEPSSSVAPARSSTSVEPDATVGFPWRRHIVNYRRQIRSLCVDELVQACKNLRTRTRHSMFPLAYSGTGTDVRALIDRLLTERTLVSPTNLGLQIRMRLRTRRKTGGRRVGIAEAMTVVHDRFRRIELHVEPLGTDIPVRLLDKGEVTCVFNSETVSMRMDMHHSETGWDFRPYEAEEADPHDNQLWLYQQSPEPTARAGPQTPLRTQLLGFLWGFRGGPLSRNLMLKHIGVARASFERAVGDMYKARLISVMYHPRLDYAGLPSSAFAFVTDARPTKADKFVRWLTSSMPYSRVLTSSDRSSVFAEVFFPQGYEDSVIDLLQDTTEAISEQHAAALIMNSKSYMFTVFNRLLRTKRSAWRNPWE
ncbi:MAG: hypothetical protein HXY34_05640 [Candidatus Thorarchaeota archaeon]|nr:hypothetical protein [Candidatus Thorarchaeota archaeon]